jgi:SAM-dependent methyltransferase
MRNIDQWKPTKFIRNGSDKFISNSDREFVGAGYRYIVSLQAKCYSELIQKYARENLLELGCGDLPLYEMYKNKVDQIICCDWSISYHKNLHLDFILNLNFVLPVKDSLFSTVILSDVLEHLINPDQIFSEITRVMKPGGIFFLSIPFLHPLHEEPYDYNRFTEFKLRDLCTKNNLQVLQLESYGGSFEFFADFLLKHLAKIQPDFLTWIFRKIFMMITYSRLGKKIFEKTSRKYPLGYCLVAQKSIK